MNKSLDRYYFASDNASGCVSEVTDILTKVSIECLGSYGNDHYTLQAKSLIQDFFETDCQVHFVFNGTAANCLLISTVCERFQYVLSPMTSHLETDECSAPEFFGGGTKVKVLDGIDGKLDFESVKIHLERERDVHTSPAGAIFISEVTELGSIYQLEEIAQLGSLAHRFGIGFLMDGARLANALVALNCSPADLTWKAGVSALSFGGTKQGMSPTEAIVIFDKKLSSDFDYRQKQSGQLCSKMAFLSAPWIKMLENSNWRKYANHANTMAKIFSKELALLGINPIRPVLANSIFVDMPSKMRRSLRQAGWHFYDFPDGCARLMTSWATQTSQIDEFITDVKTAQME